MARIPRFQVPGFGPGARTELKGAERHHLVDVLRLGIGAEVRLFDGRGEERSARVAEIGRASVVLAVGGRVSPSSTSGHAVAVAVPKTATFDLLVRYATELGLAALIPLRTARGVVRLEGESRMGRWERIAASAAKQCGRADRLRILPPSGFETLCRPDAGWPGRLIALPGANSPLVEAVREVPGPRLVAIGPEGGFTENERLAARRAGFVPVRLTETILRVDTAAVAAMVILATH